MGHEGSGKTTLSKEIPSAYIIDDDQILLYKDELICIGKKAAHTIRRKNTQKVVYENKTYLYAKLGLIFVLTKEMQGGSIKKIPAESVLKDPALIWHHNLNTIEQPKNYCEGKELPEVPTFLVGTDENKKETIERVIKKLDDVLTAS